MFKPFKGIKGTVLESRLLPGNFRRFPGYFRRFPGYFRLFPGYFCLFPGHFRARCFQLWTDFSPFVIIPHKKPSKTKTHNISLRVKPRFFKYRLQQHVLFSMF